MNSISLAIVFTLVSLAVFAQEKPVFTDTEAAQHVGEEGTVRGKVVKVATSAKGTTFLNFGDRYPRQTFSGVVFPKNSEVVGDVKQYEDKEVLITGRIEAGPDGKPQIVISKPDQIKLADESAAPAPAPPAAAAATCAP